MSGFVNGPLAVSRRNVLMSTIALATAASMPRPGSAAEPAKYRRWNVSDPNCPPRVLGSYKKAIRAMLALPPTDPRNWYRYALIHTLDCPHGNWWFLPWHRGYIGWFEQICRDLSGDPEFALPYWDWTKEPRIPEAMFDDVLDPNNSAFIKAAADFKAQYGDAIAKSGYWAMIKNQDGRLGPSPQYDQLLSRSIRFPEDLWFDIIDDPGGPMFFAQPKARGLSAAQPDLIIPGVPPEKQSVLIAVSISTILDALAPRDFVSFANPKAPSHGSSSGFAVLESQPHTLVHKCVGGVYNGVGGFMQAFMASVDPIFYLHHANIDRLWDVWTRKQLAKQLPILPDGYPAAPEQAPKPGSDYVAWANEPFVFFVDAKGDPVQQTTAGAYAEIGNFNYDYSPGSGEEVVPVTREPPVSVAARGTGLPAEIATQQLDGKKVTTGSVVVPLGLMQRQTEREQPKLFASVVLDLPPQGHEDYDVFLNSGNGPAPQFVSTLSVFAHHGIHGPLKFIVPLSAAFARLQAIRKFETSPTLTIQVVPRSRSTAMMAAHGGAELARGRAGDVTAISVEQL